jgi:hypothetical protein
VPAAFADEWAPTLDAWGRALLATVRAVTSRTPSRRPSRRPSRTVADRYSRRYATRRSDAHARSLTRRALAAPLPLPSHRRRPRPPHRYLVTAIAAPMVGHRHAVTVTAVTGAHRHRDGRARPRAARRRAHGADGGRAAPPRADRLRPAQVLLLRRARRRLAAVATPAPRRPCRCPLRRSGTAAA